MNFPKRIHVVIDQNASSRDKENLLAYRTLEPAVDESDATEVAEYQIVRVKKFRKQVIEVGKS